MKNLIQFSGGRTSAFLLHCYLHQARGGDWVVCFENTGKEREETLQFIREVEQRWAVPIVWLEFDDYFDVKDYVKPNGSLSMKKLRKDKYKVVNFETASRQGEPFLKLLRMLKTYRAVMKSEPPLLPNVVQRICTARLKVKCVNSYLLDQGWDEWNLYMGIRKDEEHRRAKTLQWLPDYQTLQTPLIDMQITKGEVNKFWSQQEFDLQLDANSDEGNCDLCFLKSIGKLVKIMKADRTREVFWQELEIEFQATFNRTKPSFVQLGKMIDENDPKLQKYINNPLDKTVDCFCGE